MVEKVRKRFTGMSPTRLILLGFFAAIFTGAILLTLPISSQSREFTPFVDALFTATTSVCVTGLVTVTTVEHWSLFGQVVILMLIQFGGLGVVTFSTAMLMLLKKKVSLKDRLMIQEAYNLNTLSGVVKLIRKIIMGTFLIELTGAYLYCFQFVPEFGLVRGVWISVFNSISAFCNAGIDIIDANSLAPYVTNPLINIVTMSLIVLGGIGFSVWWDVLRVGKLCIQKQIRKKHVFLKLTLHSKVVIVTTLILIFGGALLVFMLEYTNPNTIGGLTLFEKIQASFFQSVTTRTAGFLTVSQTDLRQATSFVCIILMFIGGSPAGTAGGVKTASIALLVMTIIAVARGEKNVTIFKRKIPEYTIRKCLAVVAISLMWLVTSTTLLTIVENTDFLKCFYEIASALATVGLSKDLTPTLSVMGKCIVILTMYIGRVGPITMAVGFSLKEKKFMAEYPEEDILVG